MSSTAFTESVVEDAALAWLESVDWQVAHGPHTAPDMPAAERTDYGEVVLTLVRRHQSQLSASAGKARFSWKVAKENPH